MAHLYKKVKKGRDYYYIRETQRVYGRPTTINQVYLGTADKAQVLLGQENGGGFSPKEFGSIFALNEVDRDLNLAGMVDEILPPKKRTRGPSLGELIFYAALNRAIAPRSKRQLATWYETTDIQRIRPLRLESLSSQNFWNHYDRIREADLEKIVTAFFRKVQSLLPSGEEPLVVEATNLGPSPRPGVDQGQALPPLPPTQLGLALLTGQVTGVPRYYQVFPGGLPPHGVLDGHLEGLLARAAQLGVKTGDLTVILPQELDLEALASLDAQEGYHYIGAAPGLADEVARVPLKDFRPLPGLTPEDEDPVLHYETRATLGGRQRRLIITFDPRFFQKTYQDLRKKVQKVHRQLAALAQQLPAGASEESFAAALTGHLSELCQRLQLSPGLFLLNFPKQEGRLTLAFQLDNQTVQDAVHRLGKSVLITDREDWPAEEIYRVFSQRLVLQAQGGNDRGEAGFEGRHPFPIPVAPLYHWTDSKIRVHLFVCLVALTYLALLGQRLRAAGLSVSPQGAMEEMRALRSAIYLSGPTGKLRRGLGEVNESQQAILKALGYEIRDGKVVAV